MTAGEPTAVELVHGLSVPIMRAWRRTPRKPTSAVTKSTQHGRRNNMRSVRPITQREKHTTRANAHCCPANTHTAAGVRNNMHRAPRTNTACGLDSHGGPAVVDGTPPGTVEGTCWFGEGGTPACQHARPCFFGTQRFQQQQVENNEREE